MRKFLVIQTASIGDVVLATSLLEELHYNYPTEKIDILLKKGNEPLFKEHPFIGKVFVWNKDRNKYKNLITLIKDIQKQDYEYVININRFFSSGLITAFSKAHNTIGFKKNPFSFLFDVKIEHQINRHKHIHEIERNFELISDICEDDETDVLSPKLYPSKKAIDNTQKYRGGIYYTISPSSLWFTKQFYTQGWIEFLKNIPKDRMVYLLGGKADIELCNYIIKESSNSNVFSLAGKLNYLESCALMQTAKMNFTNDSAPLHFASSLNAPLTAIFCSTIPAFGFTPLSEDSKIIQVRETLSCRPCGLHGHRQCPKKHFECATKIDINELIKRL